MIDYTKVPSRDILAVDVKSFFASVESVKLGLHPLHSYVVVISGKDRPGGVVLAASPLMKSEFGIKTGSRAYEIPKDKKIKIVEPRMKLYLKVNGLINDIFRKYVAGEDLYTYSIDESLLDVTASKRLFGDARTISRKIQLEIWNTLKLVVAIGIGDNPLMAKLAMDNAAKHSPEGIAEWRYNDVPNTVWKIPKLTDFWGIGEKTAKKLYLMGIINVYELAHAEIDKLKRKFGVLGEQLYYHAHGVGYSILRERYKPKSASFGNGQTLMRDYTKKEEIEIIIREMSEQVAARLRKIHVKATVIKLSITYSRDVFERGFLHQMTVLPTCSTHDIINVCISIFRAKYKDGQPVRHVGITCGKIQHTDVLQLNLFENPERTIANERLDRVIDRVRDRYGFTSLIHASSMMPGGNARVRSSYVGGHKG